MKREKYTDEFLAWVDLNKKATGDRIIYFRKKLGISQKKLSEKSEVSVSAIQRIEKGNGNPLFSTLTKIIIDGLEISLPEYYKHPSFDVKPPKGPILKNPPQPKKKVTKKRKTK